MALAMLALSPLAYSTGVPAFEQDWQWPLHQAQCIPFAHLGSEPWNSTGLGAPQSYPEPWLPYAISGSLCAALGPHPALLFYLLILLAVAVCGIAWLARASQFVPASSLCLIAFYIGNPVILNKVHAGHLHFLFSYALLPCFLAGLVDPKTRTRPLLLGTLLGLAGAQQQFLVFGTALGILLGLRLGPTWLLRTGLPALAVALIFTMPQWLLAAYSGSGANLAVYRPLVHWEESQSTPFSAALRFLGYIGGYDSALPSWLQNALWVFPIASLAGAIIAIVRSAQRAWILAGIPAMLMVAGFYGPLAPILRYFVEHTIAFAPFRELYAFEAVVAICYAMLIGCAIQALATSAKFRLSTLPVCLILIATSLSVTAYETKNLPFYTLSREGAMRIDQIAAAPGLTRYLPVPSGLPQSLAGEPHNGLSPFMLPIGEHASALATLSETPIASIVSRQSANRKIPAALLRQLAISYTLSVPGVQQSSAYEPQLKRVLPKLPAAEQKYWQLSTERGERIAWLSGASLDAVERMDGTQVDLNALSVSVNPRQSWARTSLWSNLPAWIYDRPSGIFTTLPQATVILPSHSSVLAGSADGKLSAVGCIYSKAVDAHFSVFDCNGTATFRGTAPIAISEAITGRRIAFVRSLSRADRSLVVVQDRRWQSNLSLQAPPGAILVLRERFDPGWECISCDAIHVRADGYANAWVFPRGVRGSATLMFGPARAYFAALTISFAVLMAALIQLLMLSLQRQKVFRQP